MDKESKKALDDKYGVPDDVETFAAGIADKEDNPTIYELAKSFPEKTYKELESYRNADRHEEANQIPLTQAQKNLVDHIESAVEKNKTRQLVPLTESQQKQKELEPIEDALGACITAGMKRDKAATELQVMKRRAQEAQGELSILKGIETNRVKEAQDALANALEVNESHQRLNGKLQVRIVELEEENKRMHDKLDKKIDNLRKAGM
jgi:hypothetical protein